MAAAAARLGEHVLGAALHGDRAAQVFALFALGERRDHRSAGAVAEQHAGVAVLVVEDAAEDLRAADEHLRVGPAAHHVRADLGREHEAAARSSQVEAARVLGAEVVADAARRRRERLVTGHRRADHQVQVLGRHVGVLEGLPRRVDRQGAGHVRRGRDAPLLDAGPLDDPLVRRVDDLLEVLVGQALLRHVSAEPCDADFAQTIHHRTSMPGAGVVVCAGQPRERAVVVIAT